MKSIRIKLLIPTILITVLSFALILYISYQQYISYKITNNLTTSRISENIISRLEQIQARNNELVTIFINNWGFIDNVKLKDINKLLNHITPLYSNSHFGIVNVYDETGKLLVCPDRPGVFNKPDDISPLLSGLNKKGEILPTAVMHNGKLSLITIKRIDGTNDKIGFVVVGMYLTPITLPNTGVTMRESNLQFLYEGKEYIMLGDSFAASIKCRTNIIYIPKTVDASGLLSVKLNEDVSQAKYIFWKQFIMIGLVLSIISLIIIIFSRKITLNVTGTLKKSKDDLENAIQEHKHIIKERIKELSLLYRILEFSGKAHVTLEEILQNAVVDIPNGWQYPDITGCRITVDGKVYKTKNFKKTQWMLTVDRYVEDKYIGTIDVCYLQEKPDEYEGPFLKEERDLIENLARQLGEYVIRIHETRIVEAKQKRLGNILEGTNAGTWDWNIITGELILNGRWAEIMGYTLEEMEPIDVNTWINNIHPDELPMANALLEKHFSGEADYYDMDFRQPHKNGSWVWVNARGRVVDWTKDGKPLHMSGTHMNINERKQVENELKKQHEHLEDLIKIRTDELEEKANTLQDANTSLTYLLEDVNEVQAKLRITNSLLEASNEELEAFSYSVSHDLRAPLRHIDGFTKLVYSNIKNLIDEKSHKYFDNIISSTKQMNKLIDDLLLFSRMGRKKVERTKINMKTVVDDAVHLFESEINKNNIAVIVDDMPDVRIDSSLMQQVWVNLISNAIKFSRNTKNAKIHIGTETDVNGKINYFIKDNGAGFDQKYITKLFGVFQRLHSVSEFEGTGIGLASVKRIILKHGGSIRAEGTINKGASFFFWIYDI